MHPPEGGNLDLLFYLLLFHLGGNFIVGKPRKILEALPQKILKKVSFKFKVLLRKRVLGRNQQARLIE